MSLFFQPDDIANRARSNGRSVFEQIKTEHQKRVRSLAYHRQAAMKRKQLEEERADKAARAAEEIAKRQLWRISWANMINLQKAADRSRRDLLYVSTPSRKHRLTSIVREVCDRTSISVEDLNGDGRAKPLVRVRHYIFWRARKETSLSTLEIGRRVGGRDHTTVLHGVRKFQRALDAGEEWAVALAGDAR